MRNLEQLNHGSGELSRIVTAQMIALRSSVVNGNGHHDAKSNRAPNIPNEFMRALCDFSRFVADQGENSDQQLAQLLNQYRAMSPMSRESAAQVLDFILAVLKPLSEQMKPCKPRPLAAVPRTR